MALQTTLMKLIEAADALSAGETASYIVPESLLKADIVALDTWISATDNGYSITITKLFTQSDTIKWNNTEKDVDVTEGQEYFMVTIAVPEAAPAG